MIIDSHCHAGKGDGLTGPWDTDARLGAYLRRAARAGIGRTVLFAAFSSDYRAANAEVGRIVARYPGRFSGYAMVDAARDAGRVRDIVAEAVRVVRESGLPNRTDAMFTTIEGDWEETMAVVKRAVDTVAARAPRVSLVLKADLRPGVTDALTAKVETVERYLRS